MEQPHTSDLLRSFSLAQTLARQHPLPEKAVVVNRRNSQQRGWTLLLQPSGGDA